MSIIAEESGLAVSDLSDSTVFADVGIDSLLSLTITARFKEELDVDMEFSTFFFDYPTVSSLKGFFGELQSSPTVSSLPSSVQTLPTPRSSETTVSTPTTDDDFLPKEVTFLRALQIISEESGVAVEGLTDDTNLAASGVDSLLSLVIISRFRDELDLDIQHESLFLECPTIGDLRQVLVGKTTDDTSPPPESAPLPPKPTKCSPSQTGRDLATTTERLRAVDSFVQTYTAGFTMPSPAVGLIASSDGTKSILVTGASGSLGSHLVYHLAQLPDVRTVICLNRKTSEEPYTRQYAAMREKGIRFPDALKSKLLVLQTDSSQPCLGLSRSGYEGLVSSVTHLIHNAWPMSAKRSLVGFGPQFQVMRNLIDFACAVVARRPHGFKFSFQLVSSIGVVGNYGLTQKNRTTVPEERVGIDAVLPNGYGEAKWGCERMLDETLHRYPDLFRVMAVRLGQIAGSKTSGYWNPMEHFGFLIKSSQTLKALPDVPGTVHWTPVNDVAGTLADLILSDRSPYPVYHIENPVGQPWRETNAILADALNIQTLIPFEEWVQRVREAPMRNNPAATLLEFLDSNYLRMSCGGLVLDTRKTLEHSKTLAAVGKVSEEVVRKYIHIWKEIGFLN
jgi:thioester reductase-like protein/acyl carrier protein